MAYTSPIGRNPDMTAENQHSTRRFRPHRRWMAVFLSLFTVLATLVVYGAENWNPDYAYVFWYLLSSRSCLRYSGYFSSFAFNSAILALTPPVSCSRSAFSASKLF